MTRQSKVRALTVIAMLTGSSLGAQSNAQVPSTLRLTGGIATGKSLVVAADQPTYFALFAVGRGRKGNPVQMLTPASAVRMGAHTPAKRTTVTPLSPAALGRFAASDEMVVVALASNKAAALDAFLTDGRPASDLALPDSIVSDGQRLIATLAATVYGPEVRYTGRILPIGPQTIPLPPNVAMDHCGEAANPPAGGYAFSAASSPNPVVIDNAGTQRSMNDDSFGAVSVVRLPGCTALVYRMMPSPPVQAPYPQRPASSAPSTPVPVPVPPQH